MDRALIALSALIAAAVFGGPRTMYISLGLAGLARLPSDYFRTLERKLNRDHRSPQEREMRGLFLVSAVTVASIVLGMLCERLFRGNFNFIELVVVAMALPVRPLWDRGLAVSSHLRAGNLAAARSEFEGTDMRHHALLDEHACARAAIEMLAVQFCEKILSPLVGYLLFGLAGLFIVKSVTIMQSAVASAETPFSKPIHHAHTWIHYIPARLAAVCWLAGALFLPGASYKKAAATIAAHAGAPSHLLLLHMPASVLALSLGGPLSLYASKAWVGSGVAKAGPADIKRALYLFALFHFFLIVGLGVFL